MTMTPFARLPESRSSGLTRGLTNVGKNHLVHYVHSLHHP